MYDGLVAFKKVSGQQSFTVVPDLAEAMPKVDRRRQDLHLQAAQGHQVLQRQDRDADDVVASFQRIFKVSSPTAGTFYNGIVGADACLKTPGDLHAPRGVVGDDAASTVTIHLSQPDPEFLYKLAVPHASILPKRRAAEGRGHASRSRAPART